METNLDYKITDRICNLISDMKTMLANRINIPDRLCNRLIRSFKREIKDIKRTVKYYNLEVDLQTVETLMEEL